MSNRYLWLKPDLLESMYVLHHDDQKIGSLRFEAFRSRAQAEWNGIKWTIDRVSDSESSD